ncbi:MAG: hypothetical protein ACYCYM_10995 [Saccharofermentanales bacterium]
MEYQSFEQTIEALSNSGKYFSIREISARESAFDISDYLYLFTIPDEKRAKEAFRSLTKRQVEGVLFGASKIADIFGAGKLVPLFQARYRLYMFRIVYLLWQDLYDISKYREFFLSVFRHPKTAGYADEVHFTADTLIELAASHRIENKLSDLARQEKLDMREFLAFHKINRESVLGIDLMSIFFLFCTAGDYLEFGPDRLIIASTRLDMKNQAKMLNNMIRVLSKEERSELTAVIGHFIGKYENTSSGIVHEFWGNVYPAVRATIQEEFAIHIVM